MMLIRVEGFMSFV